PVGGVRKPTLVGSIRPRWGEPSGLLPARLESSGFDKIAGRRVVLTGGASQLGGVRELAGLVLDKQIRMGRPIRIGGLAEAAAGAPLPPAAGPPAHAPPAPGSPFRPERMTTQEEPNGLMGRIGHWLRENF